jgi:hypothetical protein
MKIQKLVIYFFVSLLIIFIILLVSDRHNIERFENIVIPELNGGLGNNLFQLAAALGFARKYNKTFQINKEFINNGPHANNAEYFNTIFKRFAPFIGLDNADEIIEEDDTKTANYENIDSSPNKLLKGFFQNIAYIEPVRREFISLLSFNTAVANKYDKLQHSMFIHLRGGDYKQSAMHNLDLTKYYNNALKFCKSKGVAHYYIFTNDKNYAQSQTFLKDIDHTFVDENEVDSLYLMSRCQLGGVGANSSFSFWGLYLNIERPYLILPDKWYTSDKIYTKGLYFNNVQRIPVD